MSTGKPLKDEFTRGFEYSDCWVEDARLVVLNARDAADRGRGHPHADEMHRGPPRRRRCGRSTIDREDGAEETVARQGAGQCRGPWVGQVLGAVVGRNDPDKVRLVKGSHIVVDKLYDHDRCYIFQNADGRICFAIPYEQDFTLIGTTDEDHKGDPGKPRDLRRGDRLSAARRPANISSSR